RRLHARRDGRGRPLHRAMPARHAAAERRRKRRLRRRRGAAHVHDRCELDGARRRNAYAHARDPRAGVLGPMKRRFLAGADRNARVGPMRSAAGMTLVELMVALAVGSFLLIGAITVFVQSRATFRVADSVSRLQENGRFVLDALEPDVRMASYFGLTTRPEKIVGRARPEDPASADFAVSGDCGHNWTIHLDAPIDGTNNGYAWDCEAYGNEPAPDADTLVVRRVAEEPDAPAAGRLQVQSARFLDSELFVGAGVPAGFTTESSETYRLVVNGYYVSKTSTLSTPDNLVPSLRVKTLIDGPKIEDREVLPGVEDMQVQFGID